MNTQVEIDIGALAPQELTRLRALGHKNCVALVSRYVFEDGSAARCTAREEIQATMVTEVEQEGAYTTTRFNKIHPAHLGWRHGIVEHAMACEHTFNITHGLDLVVDVDTSEARFVWIKDGREEQHVLAMRSVLQIAQRGTPLRELVDGEDTGVLKDGSV